MLVQGQQFFCSFSRFHRELLRVDVSPTRESFHHIKNDTLIKWLFLRSSTKDLVENRFQAKYDAEALNEEVLKCSDLKQKFFSRSYTSREPTEALELVLDWLWRKHTAITKTPRPDHTILANIPSEKLEMLCTAPRGALKRGQRC